MRNTIRLVRASGGGSHVCGICVTRQKAVRIVPAAGPGRFTSQYHVSLLVLEAFLSKAAQWRPGRIGSEYDFVSEHGTATITSVRSEEELERVLSGLGSFGLQIAADCGCPALFISCEMAPVELLRRIIARQTQTYLGRFRTGELSPQDVSDLANQAIKNVPELCIVDATTAWASPDFIVESAGIVKGLGEHLLIVLDSLHSWVDASNAGMAEYERISEGVRTLQTMAARIQAPVVFIAERNRAHRNDGGLVSTAGSRKIEYGAETQIDLDADEAESNRSSGGPSVIKLRFSKNRHGAVGTQIQLVFDGACQSFTEGPV